MLSGHFSVLNPFYRAKKNRSMANRKVSLQLYAKTETRLETLPCSLCEEWSRASELCRGGRSAHAFLPKATTKSSSIRAGRHKQRNVGTDAQAAEQARDREANLLAVRHDAGAIGAKLLEEQGRMNLAKEADRFVQAAEDRGSREAAEVYRATVDEFLEVDREDLCRRARGR